MGYKKLTDYGVQLNAKQKLKKYYGDVGEKQFRAIYQEAARRKGDTGENMIGLLESRLDAIVYRANFVPTVWAARQLVNHGHVMVDGRKVTIPSYRVRPGQVIEVREKSKHMALIVEAVQSKERPIPEYISVDNDRLKVNFSRVPVLADVPFPVIMEPQLVVEFYSR